MPNMNAVFTAQNILIFCGGAGTFAFTEFVTTSILRSIRHYRRKKRLASPEYQRAVQERDKARMAEIAREIADIYSPVVKSNARKG